MLVLGRRRCAAATRWLGQRTLRAVFADGVFGSEARWALATGGASAHVLPVALIAARHPVCQSDSLAALWSVAARHAPQAVPT
jgi:hypothetical protein